MNGPYHGLRVLDLSHVIAGPFCTRLLADMGADVVRVEPRRGDLMRTFPVRYGDAMSSAYAQYNCGKKAVCIDLKSDAGRDLALDLAQTCDVVVENLSPGALDRLGMGYQVLHSRRPGIILCSLSTFGAVGPYAGLSGYGLIAEAYSGLMSLTGDEGGSPMHFGTPLADMNAGVHALAAIGAALFRRGVDGLGAHIDLSSFDALVSMIDQAVAMASFSGGALTFGRYGTTHPTSVPSAVVAAADGRHVAYTAIGDVLFRELVTEMERPGLAEDPRFRVFIDRIANRVELYSLIKDWAASVPTADELVRRLSSRGISAARVRTVEENLDDPHLLQRGTLKSMQIDGVGQVVMPSAPYRFSGCSVGPDFPAAEIGAHTDEVLRDRLGLTDATLAMLHARGVIYSRNRAARAGPATGRDL
jgi:crotonobetainyl-CoA:carnitine CoA-transferase CaiB-like acyl-CoA transferase